MERTSRKLAREVSYAKLAQEVLKGNYAWLEEGAITTLHGDTGVPPSPGAGSAGTPDKRGSLSGERVATQVGAGA